MKSIDVNVVQTRRYRHPLHPAQYTVTATDSSGSTLVQERLSTQAVLAFLTAAVKRGITVNVTGDL